MDENVKQINRLRKIALDGESLRRLKESDEWRGIVEALETDVEQELLEMLKPETTSQRYYELRASINKTKKLFDTIDTKINRGRTASRQKQNLEN